MYLKHKINEKEKFKMEKIENLIAEIEKLTVLELADLVKDINCYVNLIPYNEVSTKPFKKTSSEDAQRFFEILHQRGINATLRMEHGSDISAACGQLRAKKILEENNE